MAEHGLVQHIIAAFGRAAGIHDLGLEEGGYCCLLIDQDPEA